MCGIVGVFSLNGSPAPRVLDEMNRSLVHRGPDDAGALFAGTAGLAMRRLSIIGVHNGRQPIFSENQKIALVLNGEIYNYRSLRTELEARGHRFATDSDAEVAVHLYEERGLEFIDRLRGMFALALYDRSAERLVLVRDRLGKKPLYWATRDGLLLFGSEIKALFASGLLRPSLDTAGVRAYLGQGFVGGERTLFDAVNKLPPGCFLEVVEGGVRVERYWDLVDQPQREIGLEPAARRVRELLEESVRIRLMSEVPLGAFLSGGIDSSVIVGIMSRQLEQPVQTFSVGFADSRYDELPHARRVAEHFGTDHHEVLVRGVSPELLREINWHHDEPAGDPASVPTHCLARFARRHVTVVLTGEGGDEIFGGYDHYRRSARLNKLQRWLPGSARLARSLGRSEHPLGAKLPRRLVKGLWIAGLPAAARFGAWNSAFTDSELDRLLGEKGASRPHRDGEAPGDLEFLDVDFDAMDDLARHLYLDSRSTLADLLLMKVDKMTMAASLEARCPLLDQELVAYLWGLPSELKVSGRDSKLVFRHAVQDLVPPTIAGRPKHGFDVPLRTWLLRDLADLAEELLLAPSAAIGEILDREVIRASWVSFRRRPDASLGFQLWRILNLAVWKELSWAR